MKMRTLGRNGTEASASGLGCMRMSYFPGAQKSRNIRNDDESVATIEAVLDAGITLINTGGMGHNESLVARAISERRDEVFLSVKFGAQRSPSGAFLGVDARPNSVKNFAAYSLQRLGVDVSAGPRGPGRAHRGNRRCDCRSHPGGKGALPRDFPRPVRSSFAARTPSIRLPRWKSNTRWRRG